MKITNYFDKFNNSGKELIIKETYFNNNYKFVILSLDGQIETYNSPVFYKVIKDFLILEERLVLVLDINFIYYISSTGIGTLLQLDKDCKADGIKLYLMGIQKNIDEIFSLLGFKTFFSYITDLNDIKEEKIIRSVFPINIKCPHCQSELIILKTGAFKCKNCQGIFRVLEENNEIKIIGVDK